VDGVFEEAKRPVVIGPAEIAVAVMAHQDSGGRRADLVGCLEFAGTNTRISSESCGSCVVLA
jgi:hypothetical protein